MLKNTFHHIPGIGAGTESGLWKKGLNSWKDIKENNTSAISAKRLSTLKQHVDISLEHLGNSHFKYFEEQLPSNLIWRIFPEVRSQTAYLDIETTGLEGWDKITTIALYDGKEIKTFVNGDNLEHFPEAISAYGTVVTYNGKCFDVPFIENFFNIKMDQVHIDLRYILKSLGYGGGLKACEKKLGIDRGGLDGVDGLIAIQLWQDYQRHGNEKALETLLAYNIEDVVNLETLMVMAYNKKLKETPFSQSHQISLPAAPEIEFKADAATVTRLKSNNYY
ncbi:MAG: ribonuclease H-like domain-containing protein [Desulfobacterium sp.]